MLLDKSRKKIVDDFIDLHNDESKFWFEHKTPKQVYYNLIGDAYGETRDYGRPSNEIEIEIPSHHSKSGNPILFTWVSPQQREKE